MAAQNPHIPKYIKDAPWYADKKGDEDDYLSHHRSGKEETSNSEAKIGSGIKDDFIAADDTTINIGFKKRRKKGGCANCGALDHDKRDCLEKPKVKKVEKSAVPSTGKGKRNEDVDYDGKRDRWYGYDASEYKDYVKKWEKKQEEGSNTIVEDRQFDTDEEIELKELGLWEENIKNDVLKAEGEKIVRLREDRAVYLNNIRDDDVAYDPKSRTMRDEATGYFDENGRFVRHLTGDAVEIAKSQKLAWENDTKRGSYVGNSSATPTLAEKKMKELTKEEKAKKDKIKRSLLDMYGGDDAADDAGDHVEENSDEENVRSQYDEDVYLGNHTSVWGSYYEDGKWGYRCCKSLVKGSVCK